jgi:hypothetical protein
MIGLFDLRPAGLAAGLMAAAVPAVVADRTTRSTPGPTSHRAAARKGCAVATQPSGKTAPEVPHYLRAAEVADILHVSPKTVSRWAKEGKLPS